MKIYKGEFKNIFRQIFRKSLFGLIGTVIILLNLGLFYTPLNAYAADADIKIEGFHNYQNVEKCNYSLDGTKEEGKENTYTDDGTKKTFNCVTLQAGAQDGKIGYTYNNVNLNEFDYYKWKTDDPLLTGNEMIYHNSSKLDKTSYNGSDVFEFTGTKFLKNFKNFIIYKVMKFTPEWENRLVNGTQDYRFEADRGQIFYSDGKDPYTSYYEYNAVGDDWKVEYNKYAEMSGYQIKYLLDENNVFYDGQQQGNGYNDQYHVINGVHKNEFKLQEYVQNYVTVDKDGIDVSKGGKTDSYIKTNGSGSKDFYIWDNTSKRFYIYNINVVKEKKWLPKEALKTIDEQGHKAFIEEYQDALVTQTKEYRKHFEDTYKLKETIKTESYDKKFDITSQKFIPSESFDNSYVSYKVDQNAISYDVYYEYQYQIISERSYDYTFKYQQQQYQYNLVDKTRTVNFDSQETYSLNKIGDTLHSNTGHNRTDLKGLVSSLTKLNQNSQGSKYYTENPTGKWDWIFKITTNKYSRGNGQIWDSNDGTTHINGTDTNVSFSESKDVLLGDEVVKIHKGSDGNWYVQNGADKGGHIEKMKGYDIAVVHKSEDVSSENANQYQTSTGVSYDTIVNSYNGQSHVYYDNSNSHQEYVETVYDIEYRYASKNGEGTPDYSSSSSYDGGTTYENGIKNTTSGNTFKVRRNFTSGHRQDGYIYVPKVDLYKLQVDTVGFGDYAIRYFAVQYSGSASCSANTKTKKCGDKWRNQSYFVITESEYNDPSTLDLRYKTIRTLAADENGSNNSLANDSAVLENKIGKKVKETTATVSTLKINSKEMKQGFESSNKWDWEATTNTTHNYFSDNSHWRRNSYTNYYRINYDNYKVYSGTKTGHKEDLAANTVQTLDNETVYILSCTPRDVYKTIYTWKKHTLTVSKTNLESKYTGRYDIASSSSKWWVYNSSNNLLGDFNGVEQIKHYADNKFDGFGTVRSQGYGNDRIGRITYATNGDSTVTGDYNIKYREYSWEGKTFTSYSNVTYTANHVLVNEIAYSKTSAEFVKNTEKYKKYITDVSCPKNGNCSFKSNLTDVDIKLHSNGSEYFDYDFYEIVRTENFTNKQTTPDWTKGKGYLKLFDEKIAKPDGTYAGKDVEFSGKITNGNVNYGKWSDGVTKNASTTSMTTVYDKKDTRKDTQIDYTYKGLVDVGNYVELHVNKTSPDYNVHDFNGALNSLTGKYTSLTPCSETSTGKCYKKADFSKVQLEEEWKDLQHPVKITYTQSTKDGGGNNDMSQVVGAPAYYGNNLPGGERLCDVNNPNDINCVKLKSATAKVTGSTHNVLKTTKTYTKEVVQNNTEILNGVATSNSYTNNYYELGRLTGAKYETNSISGGNIVDRTGHNEMLSYNRFDMNSWFVQAPSGNLHRYMQNGHFLFKGNGSQSQRVYRLFTNDKPYYVGFTAKGKGTIKVTVGNRTETFTIGENAKKHSFSFAPYMSDMNVIFEFINAEVEIYDIYVSQRDSYSEYATYRKGDLYGTQYSANTWSGSSQWKDAVQGLNGNLALTKESYIIGYDNQVFKDATKNFEQNQELAIKEIYKKKYNNSFVLANVKYFLDANNNGKIEDSEIYSQNNYSDMEVQAVVNGTPQKFKYILTNKAFANIMYRTFRNVTITFSNSEFFGTKTDLGITNNKNSALDGVKVSKTFDELNGYIDFSKNKNDGLSNPTQYVVYNNHRYPVDSIQGKYALAKECFNYDTDNLVVTENGVVSRLNDRKKYVRYTVKVDKNKTFENGVVSRKAEGYKEEIITLDKQVYWDLLIASGLKTSNDAFTTVKNSEGKFTIKQDYLKQVKEGTKDEVFSLSSSDINFEGGKYVLAKEIKLSAATIDKAQENNLFEGTNNLQVAIENNMVGTFNEYFVKDGIYYRLLKDENQIGFTGYQEYYIGGSWESRDLLNDVMDAQANGFTELGKTNISPEFENAYKLNGYDFVMFKYANGNKNVMIMQNIVLKIYHNPNGATKDVYSNNRNDKYYYTYELAGGVNKTNTHRMVGSYTLSTLQEEFTKQHCVGGCGTNQKPIYVNSNIFEVEGARVNILEKFILNATNYAVYNLKQMNTDVKFRNIISLSELYYDGTDFLEYDKVDLSNIKTNKAYGLKFSGMLNYWNNTINDTTVYNESSNLIDATGVVQKESYINFDGDKVPEFIINGKGDTSFDVYGLEKVIQKEVIYEMEDIIGDAIKILNSYVMEQSMNGDANYVSYLMKGVTGGFSYNASTTDSLMGWDDIIKKGKFYDTFSNSSLLNVLYYVKDGRGYVKQYDASKNEEIFNNFKGLEAIMNLYMMGSNDGEIDFQSLFVDNSIGQRSVGVGKAWEKGKEYWDSPYTYRPSGAIDCENIYNGSLRCKFVKDPAKTSNYSYLNDIYNSIFKTDITLNNQGELNNIKFNSKQSLGQPIDNYIFRDAYMAPNGRAVSSNNFKIDGFVNLLNSIINSKSSEYMLVKSNVKEDRYYAYKKLDKPEIIRTHDDNYNSLRIFKDGNYKSLGQYIFEMVSKNDSPGGYPSWRYTDIYNFFYNSSNDFIGGLFTPVNILDYFDINGSTGKQIFTVKNDVSRKNIISLEKVLGDKLKYYISDDEGYSYFYDSVKKGFYDKNGIDYKNSSSSDNFKPKYKENFILDVLGVALEKIVDINYSSLFVNKFKVKEKFLYGDFALHLSDYALEGNPSNDGISIPLISKILEINGVKYNKDIYDASGQRIVTSIKEAYYDFFDKTLTYENYNNVTIKFDPKEALAIRADLGSSGQVLSNSFYFSNSLKDKNNYQDNIKKPASFSFEISSYIGKTKSTLKEDKTGSFTIDKNITNDKEQTLNGITDFSITINNNDKKLYNYHLSYDLKPNETCGENFVKVGGKCYYKHPATRIEKENVASTFALRPNISNDGCIYGPDGIYICPEVTPPISPTPPSTTPPSTTPPSLKPNHDKEVSNNTINGTESDGVLFNFTQESKTIINNLPQRKKFTLSYGFRDGSGVYKEIREEIFTTGMDMVRNPYGTTLSGAKKVSLFALPNTDTCIRNELTGDCITPDQEQLPIPKPQLPKHCAIETIGGKEQVVCDGNAWLKEEFIPYDLKEWLFEKQYTELVGEQRKEINGYIYTVDAKYLSKLSKNNTIRIGFALVGKDGVVNVNEQMKLKFVNDIGGSGYHENTYNLSGSSASITSKDGIFYYDLTDKEKILFKNVYNEDYARFVDEYIFKNYIIEVETDEFLNLSDVYTLKAMSFHDNRWSYLDYNQNNIMDERLDSTYQYYDQKGEIVFGESRTQFTPEIKPGLDNTVVGPNWHTSQIAGLTEWKMFRFYTKEGYKYYITGYNRNNGSNIIK